MAKLKLRIPSLDALPKEQREFYRAMEGGGFILDHEEDPEGWGIDNLRDLRGKLGGKDTDIGRLNSRIQGFKKADGSLWTPEELAALTSTNADLTRTLETLRDKSKTDEQKVADLVAQAKAPLEAKLAKAEQQITTFRAAEETSYRNTIVQRALDKAKPQDRWKSSVRRDIESRIKVERGEDGTLKHYVVNDDGTVRYSSLQGQNGAMQIDEYVAGGEFRATFGDCLVGDGKKGAGIVAPPSGKAAGGQGQGGQAGGGFQNGDRFVVQGNKVILPETCSQNDFEAAFAKAREIGGEIEYAPAAAQEGATTE